MNRAIRLAARARHSTSPNPMVGAVVVRAGKVVGEGYHLRAGGPHAEIVALRRAGEAARGATMFVSLEPCVHMGRTAPCADAIVAAGLARVVVAHRDPYAAVSGRGIRRLRDAGIEVEVGDGEAAARALNVGWLRAQLEHRPFVALKYAATLDGKTASRTGVSQWITGEAARAETHRLRRVYDAIAVGAQTVLADDPQLTARPAARGRQPLRVVVDGRLSSDPGARLHDQPEGASLVLAAAAAPASRRRLFQRQGVDVEVIDAPSPSGSDLLAALGRRGVTSVLVEGGGELAWSFVEAGLVDRVYAFFAPLMLGGRSAPTPVGGGGFERLSEALRLDIVNLRRLGADVIVDAVAA
ncbi:MAG: diaminohydroxyphosphoribosylaminopyrimidine deaminase [Chloroflexota bacterium]|nr:diaminohydroxyphosphoribosylaminopyrimidine deaminase [Chloroflexota bacterium]